MDTISLQKIVAMAKSDGEFFRALRSRPESVIADFGRLSDQVGSAMLSVSRDTAAAGLLKAGFHDGCQCTSCGCGGSIIFPPANA